jgi:hypothetical protein
MSTVTDRRLRIHGLAQKVCGVRSARRGGAAGPSDCSDTRSRHLKYPPENRLRIRFNTVRMVVPKLRSACKLRRSREAVSVYADDCMSMTATVVRRHFVWVLQAVPCSTLRIIFSSCVLMHDKAR